MSGVCGGWVVGGVELLLSGLGQRPTFDGTHNVAPSATQVGLLLVDFLFLTGNPGASFSQCAVFSNPICSHTQSTC